MINPTALVIGPLMVPECLRATRRGWVLLARALAAVAFAVPVLAALWWWWMSAKLDPSYRPTLIVPTTLGILEALSLTFALVLAPAILGGSLAGDKERGSIGLLLSTRVDAREIVLGRLCGRLSLVAAILMAGVPFLLGFAVLADLSPGATLALMALPATVGFGAGGLTMMASAIARRGRNALIAVYVGEVLLLAVPSALAARSPLTGFAGPWPTALNPYLAIEPVLSSASAAPGLGTLMAWTLMGGVGCTVASYWLRRSFLAMVGGPTKGAGRRRGVPAVDEARPMLWKEFYIERPGARGWIGRILGVLLLVYLVAGSLTLAALASWARFVTGSEEQFDVYTSWMGRLFADPAFLFAILVQLSVGLRAAVAVASERERGTWDALLTSPMSGREILGGKLWGSLYSLRAYVLALLLAWGLTSACGAMSGRELISLMGHLAIVSAFLVAVGVRVSLSSGTATKSMALTVGVWLAAYAGLALLAAIVMLMVMLLCLLIWLMARPFGLVSPSGRPWVPVHLFDEGALVVMALCYLSFTVQILLETRSRFDAIAGRLAGDGSDRPPAPILVPRPAGTKAGREVLADPV